MKLSVRLCTEYLHGPNFNGDEVHLIFTPRALRS